MRRIAGLLAVNVAFMALMAVLSPNFVSGSNLSSMFSNMALESIAMAGLTFLLVGRLFDLSVDGVVAMSGVVCGKLIVSGVPWVLAVIVALAVGGMAGWINGLLVMRLRINPLIATLGTWWMSTGIAYGLTRAISPFGFPDAFQVIGQARILDIRIYVWYAVIILGVMAVVLSFTRFGRHIHIMGGNPEAGRLFGVQVERIGIKLYVMMGLLSAFIGVVLASRLNSGSPNAVDGMTMRAIAAAVIGGCALSGGRGNVLSGLLGLLLMNMLTNSATILGVSPYWQKLLIGGVLLLALILDATSNKIHVPRMAHNLGEKK